ncbi:hypothetical protein RFI_12517, partial [Reticulomyxa filosa]
MAEFERSYSCSYSSGVSTEHSIHSSSGDYVVDGTIDYVQVGFKQAFKDVAKLAFPITMTALFISFLLALNLIWIGHHSTDHQFAGAALVRKHFLYFFFKKMKKERKKKPDNKNKRVTFGMSSGLDTQCGQAWGAGLKPMIGIFVQRSVLVGHVVILCIGIIFWFGRDILLALGQQHDNARFAGEYVKYVCVLMINVIFFFYFFFFFAPKKKLMCTYIIFIFALWPIAMFGNLRRYLQAQRKVVFIPIAVFLGLCAQVIALEVLVSTLNFEYVGACIALPISYWVMFLALFSFTLCKGLHKETWTGWSKHALHEWSGFLKLSIPGTLMLCAEWWAFEVLALVAAKFGTNYVSAFTVTLNALGLFLRIPLGISFACAVLVSNKLGSRFGQAARMAWDSAILLSMILASFCSLILYFVPDKLARLYTNQEEVISIIEDTLPWVAVYF